MDKKDQEKVFDFFEKEMKKIDRALTPSICMYLMNKYAITKELEMARKLKLDARYKQV